MIETDIFPVELETQVYITKLSLFLGTTGYEKNAELEIVIKDKHLHSH